MSRAERITVDTGDVASGPGRARRLAQQLKPLTLARDLTLPLLPSLGALFPSGVLQRGTTVVVTGDFPGRAQGATSLAVALASEASASGSWCAAITLPDLGLLAAAELGLELDRLAVIPHVPPAQWVQVVAALLDSIDIVLIRPPAHLRHGDARRLRARTKERGAVLIPVLDGARSISQSWAEGADIRLCVADGAWEGTGTGDGRLCHRQITVATGGRGAAARESRIRLALPATPEAPGASSAFAGSDADLLPDPAGLEPTTASELRSAG